MGMGFTVLDGDRETLVDAAIDADRVLLDDAAVEQSLGWQRKPEGMCRDGVCVPLRDPDVAVEGRLDLERLAATLRRPVAVDVDAAVAAVGAAAEERAERLASLRAPDFTLPDLEGRLHTLSAHRGKKVLLVAYASW